MARDRRISIEDGQIRHGRKNRSRRVDGYKRHLLRDLDSELVRSVGLTPANLPEAQVAGQIQVDLDARAWAWRAARRPCLPGKHPGR